MAKVLFPAGLAPNRNESCLALPVLSVQELKGNLENKGKEKKNTSVLTPSYTKKTFFFKQEKILLKLKKCYTKKVRPTLNL